MFVIKVLYIVIQFVLIYLINYLNNTPKQNFFNILQINFMLSWSGEIKHWKDFAFCPLNGLKIYSLSKKD